MTADILNFSKYKKEQLLRKYAFVTKNLKDIVAYLLEGANESNTDERRITK